MSDPMNPAAPAARERPSTVTISSYLLMLVAALQVIGLIVAFSVMGAMREAYEEAFAGTDMANQAGTVATVTVVGTAVLGLLVAVGLVVLAMLNNRGKNASRIVTWVLGGLFLCCSGVGLVLNAAGGTFGMDGGGANAPDQNEVRRVLEERLPSWYEPVSVLISVIVVLALLVALILLALPSSNEFFRRPQAPAWEPPVPGSAYPGYPPPSGPGMAPGQQPGYPGPMPPPGGQPGSQPPPPGGPQPPYPPSS